MTIDTRTPLTREQLLMAEIVVQLGNVTEAIQSAAKGEDSSVLNDRITQLEQQMANLVSQNAALSQQLADSNTLAADLQQQLNESHAGDITPDNIQEVIQHLGIEVAE